MTPPSFSLLLYLVVAGVVGTFGVTRLIRLFVDDAFPPLEWGLRHWDRLTRGSEWNTLPHCPWCIGVWLSAGSFAWAWATDLHWSWWAWNIPLAVAQVAGMINVRDLPPDQRG